eukprot:m.181730 g.181730  ORF g.181730 m.181730 type:complete len:91 (-) comp53473_c0_seq14:1468-1740(-)
MELGDQMVPLRLLHIDRLPKLRVLLFNRLLELRNNAIFLHQLRFGGLVVGSLVAPFSSSDPGWPLRENLLVLSMRLIQLIGKGSMMLGQE